MTTWKGCAVIAACVLPLALAFAVETRAQAPAEAPPGQTETEPEQTGTAPDLKLMRQRLKEQRKKRQEIEIDLNLLDKYVGYYQFDQYRTYKVTRQGDALFVELSGQDAQQVFPESPQKFFYKKAAAQLSFSVDADGHATGLVLYQGGFERSAPRIEEAQAQKVTAAFVQRVKDRRPLPSSEAALKRQIDGLEHGQPDYGNLSEDLATVTRAEMGQISRRVTGMGPLQSVSFIGVSASGWDIYAANFENGTSICRILTTPDGKVSGLLYQWWP
jgi:bla regulator protein blaR1